METSRHSATFYDGQSAVSHPVELVVQFSGLGVVFIDSSNKQYWNYDDLKVVDKPRDGVPATLTHKHMRGSQLIVRQEAYRALLPHIPKPDPPYKTAGMIVAAIAMIFILIAWLIPVAAPVIAQKMPYSWHRAVRNVAHKQLAGGKPICRDAQVVRIVDKITQALAGYKGIRPLEIQLVDSPYTNAFALPAGRILLFSQLVKEAESAEEVAGVLAHEIGHVRNNDPMESVVRNLGIGGLLEVATGGSGAALYAATLLYQRPYSRDKEHQADVYAAELMTRNGYPIDGMIALFTRMLKKEQEKTIMGINPNSLAWISTHPATQERIDYFTTFKNKRASNRILTQAEWNRLHTLKGCGF